jgi:hypothetical protein
VVNGYTKDPYHGQFLEASSDVSMWLIGVVYTKEVRSPWTIFFIVRLLVPFGMFSLSIWIVLGYASMSSQFICLLVDYQQHLECDCVEDGAFVSFVMSMEGNK